jgi:hypothetical protein
MGSDLELVLATAAAALEHVQQAAAPAAAADVATPRGAAVGRVKPLPPPPPPPLLEVLQLLPPLPGKPTTDRGPHATRGSGRMPCCACCVRRRWRRWQFSWGPLASAAAATTASARPCAADWTSRPTSTEKLKRNHVLQWFERHASWQRWLCGRGQGCFWVGSRPPPLTLRGPSPYPAQSNNTVGEIETQSPQTERQAAKCAPSRTSRGWSLRWPLAGLLLHEHCYVREKDARRERSSSSDQQIHRYPVPTETSHRK